MEQNNENNIFVENDDYIDVLLLLIKKIKSSKCTFINKYSFNESEIRDILRDIEIEYEIINEMEVYGLLDKNTITYCKSCNDSIALCCCDENSSDTYKIVYYTINQDVLINGITDAINYRYMLKLEEKKNKEDYNMYIDDKKNINIYILKSDINEEMISNINNGKNIIITLFDIVSNVDSYIYRWYDILDSGRVDFFKDKIENYLKNIRSSDSFYFDLGDDLEIADIENIRMVFREYLTNKGYKATTIERDYRPEYIDYGLSKEYLRECFIKNDNKIFIKKVKESKLEAVYFKAGIIGDGEENFNLISNFYKYISDRVQKYRDVKFCEGNIDRTNKLIQIIAPIVNIVTLIVAKSNSIQLLNNFKSTIGNSINFSGLVDAFLIVAVVINIAYMIFIGYYYVFPLFKRMFFSWRRGIGKI